MTPGRIAAWAAAAAVAATTVGGVAYSAAANNAATQAATQVTANGSDAASAAGLPRRAGRLLRRLEHGELTLRAANGTKVVDLQRGTVSAVSATSLTVRSADGFSATYTLTSSTKVRKGGAKAAVSDLTTGDHVLVVASGGDAQRVVDRGAQGGTSGA